MAAALLLIPPLAAYGGLLAAGLMSGAILSHLTVLGVVVMDDGGLLFALAWVVLLASATVIWVRRRTLGPAVVGLTGLWARARREVRGRRQR
jgi:hypothetical protein